MHKRELVDEVLDALDDRVYLIMVIHHNGRKRIISRRLNLEDAHNRYLSYCRTQYAPDHKKFWDTVTKHTVVRFDDPDRSLVKFTSDGNGFTIQ